MVGSTWFAAGCRWSCRPGTTFSTEAVTTTTIASEVSVRRRPITGRFVVRRKSWTERRICRLWYRVRWVRRGRSKRGGSCPIRGPAVDRLSGVWGVGGWADAVATVWGRPLRVAVNRLVDWRPSVAVQQRRRPTTLQHGITWCTRSNRPSCVSLAWRPARFVLSCYVAFSCEIN